MYNQEMMEELRQIQQVTSSGRSTFVSAVVMVVLATIAVTLRFVSKGYTKARYSYDDIGIGLSLAAFWADVGVLTWAVFKAGGGLDMPNIEKIDLASLSLYIEVCQSLVCKKCGMNDKIPSGSHDRNPSLRASDLPYQDFHPFVLPPNLHDSDIQKWNSCLRPCHSCYMSYCGARNHPTMQPRTAQLEPARSRSLHRFRPLPTIHRTR